MESAIKFRTNNMKHTYLKSWSIQVSYICYKMKYELNVQLKRNNMWQQHLTSYIDLLYLVNEG